MKKNLAFLAITSALCTSCMTTVAPERAQAINAEVDNTLLTAVNDLKKRGDKSPIDNAFDLVGESVVPGYKGDEQTVAENRLEMRRTQYADKKEQGIPESFPIRLHTELEINGVLTAPQPTAILPQQKTEAELKTEYDIVLLALLDDLKARGDGEYLKNAHDFAHRFIVPSFDKSVQGVIYQHAHTRLEQAVENGVYRPNFPLLLRKELELTNKIGTQKVVVPTTVVSHER